MKHIKNYKAVEMSLKRNQTERMKINFVVTF